MSLKALIVAAAVLACGVGSAAAQTAAASTEPMATSTRVSSQGSPTAPASTAAPLTAHPALTPYDSEKGLFGRLLAPSDGATLMGIQALGLYGLEFQYRQFGRPKDAVRIAQVLVDCLKHSHEEFPDDASLTQQLDQARFLLVLSKFDDGGTETFLDEIQQRLTTSADRHSTRYRQLLLDLSLASMRAGSFAVARAAAQRGLDLTQPTAPPGSPLLSNTFAQRRQAECLALENKIQQSLAEHEQLTDQETAARTAQLNACMNAQVATMQSNIDQQLYAGLLYQLAEAQMALGEDAIAEATLRTLLAASSSGFGPQAELELAELLKSHGDPDWRRQAALARHLAKWDLGVHDDAAPYTGGFLPVQSVIGPRDSAGISGLTLLRAGETELVLGRPDVAVTYFEAATPSLGDLLSKAGLSSARGDYLMGEALLEGGHPHQALPYLKNASSAFDNFSPTSRDLRRMALNRFEGAIDVHLAYLEAAELAGDEAAIDEALLRAGRSRLSRSLDAALERAGSAGDAAAVRTAQDQARRATDLDGDLQLAIARGAKQAELDVAARAAEAGHHSASEALQDAMARDPSLRLFAYGEVASMSAIQDRLPRGSGVLIYAVGRDRAFAGVITKSRVVVRKIEASRSSLQRLVAAIRSSSEFHHSGGSLGTVPFDFDASARLYGLLIAPFADELAGVTEIFIGRSPPLDGLAFGELWDQRHGRWLVDEAATAIVLDPSLLAASAPAHAAPTLKVLAMGDPKVNVQSLLRDFTIDDVHPISQTALPGARAELDAVVHGYGSGGGSIVIEGVAASASRFRAEAAKGYEVIALATHAVTQDAPLRDPRPAIVLTPDARAGDNGLLHTEDIEALKLNTDLVILSACETAAGDGAPGAEALSGLAQAFLFAGARAVLATQWKVETLSAAQLMTLTASRRSGDPDVASRLRAAMLSVKAATGTRHPAYWAPFVVVEGFLGQSPAPAAP